MELSPQPKKSFIADKQPANLDPILLVLLLLGAILRFYHLDRSLGGYDENHYLLYFGFSSLKEIVTSYYCACNHIFYTILMRLMMLAFGDENEIAIRFPSFLAGVACLWVIYKVALQLCTSLWIARISLLIAAISPIHILYSQSARGYGLAMFFSITMLYAVLRILASQQWWTWGSLAVLCGFLSVYTLPTNVYFVFGLAGWVFTMLIIQRDELGAQTLKKSFLVFACIFLGVGLLSFLAYFPVLNQMIEVSKYDISTAQKAFGLNANPIGGLITGLSLQTLELIFGGQLIWFLPLLVVGVLFGETTRLSYRLLPICIFILPLIVPLLTGVSGYPRNYLYNLPILVIFLAAGIAKSGDFLNNRLPLRHAGKLFCFAIISSYVLISFKILITEHYPSLKIPDGKLYQKKVRENSKPFDLIVIADPGNYLYTKSIYQQNLKNIFLLNKLSGIKLIASNASQAESFVLPDGRSLFPLFKGLLKSNNLRFVDVAEGGKLFTLSQENAISLLTEDFETNTPWYTLSGSGSISREAQRKATGTQSLLLEGKAEENFTITTTIPNKTIIEKPSLIVFLWTGEIIKNTNKADLFIPALLVHDMKQENSVYQLQLGKVNDGIQTEILSSQGNSTSDKWTIGSFIGKILPGEYTISLQLNVPPGQAVIYDGFRLFIIGMAE